MPPRSQEPQLLWLCALLGWFDHAALQALAGGGADVVEALLASELVEAAPQRARAYRLHAGARDRYLAQLRSEKPLTELTLQKRIFEYFVGRMRESPAAERAALEDACFEHLRELARLLAEHMEWGSIEAYAAAARAAGPRQPRHQRQLEYYAGYLAVRTQQLDRGDALLSALNARPELEDSLRAGVQVALGHRWWYAGAYDRAMPFYTRARELAQRCGDSALEAQAAITLSMIYNDINDYPRALELAHESLRIARGGHNRYREAHALYEVGNNALYLGRWREAEACCQAAIRLYEALEVRARLSMLYWNQGFLQHLLGNDAQSEAAYRRVIDLGAATAHEPALRMDTWLHLGLLYQSQGEWDAALATYDRALAPELAGQQPHRLALAHYRRGNVFERQGRLAKAYDAYAAAIGAAEQLRENTQAEEIKIGLLGTVQQIYESMVRLCLRLSRPAEAFAYVERARSRAFLDLLNARPAPPGPDLLAKVAQQPATLAEVQADLPADALLLEYFTIGVLPRGESLLHKIPPENTRLREHLALPPQTLIFAVTRDTLKVIDAPLDPNRLRPSAGDPAPAERLLRADLLPELYAQLIAPAAGLLEARRLLYIVPHGPLHYAPFAALRTPDGELLAENGPAIALAPSATILRACLRRPRSQAGARLALGYNDSAAAQLRYAEPEARHIARMAGGEAWAGPAPKSARLLADGPLIQWLHIAGHAVYDPHDPLGSALYLGAGDTLSAREIIARLALNADLVVLSACTSGVAHVEHGDELLGLQRAFLYAGAPAVVCAQWETNDLVALLVMDRFYAGLLAGQTPAAALRDAQVALRGLSGRALQATLDGWRAGDPALAAALAELPRVPVHLLGQQLYADPRHWATFVLIGRGD